MNLFISESIPLTRLILAILLHFVWQAALIGAFVAIGRSFVAPKRFQARYGLSVLGLLAVLAAPLLTAAFYLSNTEALMTLRPAEPATMTAAASNVANGPLTSLLESQFQTVFNWFDQYRYYWLGAWLLGFLVLLTRLFVSLGHCFRLRRNRVKLSPKLEKLALRLKKRLNITRDVIVASSTEITQAVATGIIKPVVLIPAAWATQLPLPAIEAVLAHELAHIKRWDLWVNLLQRFTETIFFFHPLVWWLSKTISSEREICCDQLAIQVTGQPMRYVETLAHVAGATPLNDLETQFGTTFTGGRKMNLLRRAKIILEPTSIHAASPFRALTLLVAVSTVISYASFAYCTSPEPAASLQDHDDHEVIEIRQVSGDQENEVVDLIIQAVDGKTEKIKRIELQVDNDKKDLNHDLAAQLRAIADRLDAKHKKAHIHKGAGIIIKTDKSDKAEGAPLSFEFKFDPHFHALKTNGQKLHVDGVYDFRIDPKHLDKKHNHKIEGGTYEFKVNPKINFEKKHIYRGKLHSHDGDDRVLMDVELDPKVQLHRGELDVQVLPRLDLTKAQDLTVNRRVLFHQGKAEKQDVILAEIDNADAKVNVKNRILRQKGEDMDDAIRSLQKEVKQLRNELDRLRSRKGKTGATSSDSEKRLQIIAQRLDPNNHVRRVYKLKNSDGESKDQTFYFHTETDVDGRLLKVAPQPSVNQRIKLDPQKLHKSSNRDLTKVELFDDLNHDQRVLVEYVYPKENDADAHEKIDLLLQTILDDKKTKKDDEN